MKTVTIDHRNVPSADLDPDDPRAICAAADAEALEMFWDDDWRGERLEDMSEVIYEGFEHENLVNIWSDVETAGEFERITIEEVRGLKVYWVALGSQIDQSDIDEKVWELKRDYVGFHVERHVDKMRNGFSKSAQLLQNLAITQMDAEISARVFRTFQRAIPEGSDYYIGISSATRAAVRTAIVEVMEEAKTDQVAVVGRMSAISQLLAAIQDDNTYAPETQEALLQRGIIANYWGAKIGRLVNHKDMWDTPFFPADELWVLARDASKTGFWGGLFTQEWIMPGDEYWNLKGRRQAGFAVHHPERARRFVLSSLADTP